MTYIKYFILILLTSLVRAQDIQADSVEVFSPEKLIITNSSITLTSGRVYKLMTAPLDQETESLFNQLSGYEQQKFFFFRNKMISTIISRIDSDKRNRFIGKMIIVKDKAVSFFTKRSMVSDFNAEVTDAEDVIDKIKLGQEQLQNFVTKMDVLLWKNCITLGRRNSSGASVALHGNLGLGVLKIGKLFNYSLGMGYQYNIETGKQYLEFFMMREKFKHAYTFAAPVFMGLRVNWLSIRNDDCKIVSTKKGEAHIFPLWLPKLYFSNDEFQIVNKWGVDLLDLVVLGQTAAQYYETEWEKKSFRVNIGTRKDSNSLRCLKHYTAPN